MSLHTQKAEIPIRKNLDLKSIPKASLTRQWIQIVKSGMGQAILVPVLIAKGKYEGPILGITAAVHGNELNGIPAIQKVFQNIDVNQLHGTVVGVPVVNVPGFLLNQRKFNDGQDLNRIMPGRADGNRSEVYAYRIVDRIARHFEYLIDLHTASFGRINSYYIRANMNHPITSRMALLQNAEIIVNNPAKDGTLRGAVTDLGIHAITVEAGNPHLFQKGMIRSAITGIFNVMRELDMIDEAIVQPEEAAVLCKKSYWIYTHTGGVLEIFPRPTDLVEKNARIALVRDVFGDIIKEYFAPERGIVIGKSINPENQTGSRILHLGIVKDV